MSGFEAGARVALIADSKVVAVRRIEKVYANGNFILERVPGAPDSRRPQWRGHDTTAFQCGGAFRYGAHHLEAWTQDHARRLQEHRTEVEIDKRTTEIIHELESRIAKNLLTREVVTAMETALGMRVGVAR